jgi:cell division protein FtsI/penicillin-binding protein 2
MTPRGSVDAAVHRTRRSIDQVRRGVVLAVVVALSATGLAACGKSRPTPDAAARAVAQGLSALNIAAVPFTGAPADAQQQLTDIVSGMAALRPTVSVQSVTAAQGNADAASAVFAVRWDVDGSDQDWAYTTTASLSYRGTAWTVAWSPSLVEPSLAAGEKLTVKWTAAKRADILGAGGVPLVTERPVVRVGIDKARVTTAQAATSAPSLATLLGLDPAAFTQRVSATGAKAFVEALVLRADSPDRPTDQQLAAIPGARALADALPLAPTHDFARQILGTVGDATAELIDASKGRVRPGDQTGLSGLEETYDAQLAGQSGVVVQATAPTAGAGSPRELYRRDPVDGTQLTTTLDPALQTPAEQLLAPVAPASAIVALRPSTGEILAVASGAGGNGYSTATLGKYAPGSTFKLVGALGLLRAGLTPTSTIPCTPSVAVDGRSFKNIDDYPASQLGTIRLTEVVAHSCNTAMIGQRDQVPQATLAADAAALGFGFTGNLGVPYFAGSVPTEATATEHAASMIGQGQVEASPLTMAVLAASIAKGQVVSPRLVAGTQTQPAKAEPPLTAAEADQLRQMMRAVVTEGTATLLRDVPGAPVQAKTGTAEYGTDQPPRLHSWMIAIQGDLAVVVFVEDGGTGAATAGPIIEQFLRMVG